MKNQNPRFKKIQSKLGNSNIIFDKLLDEPAIEIATNNKQMNDLMAKACLILLSTDKDFIKVVEEW